MTNFYVALTPWLAFAVADRSAGLGPSGAALVGLVVALGIVSLEYRSRRVRPLPIMAAMQFSTLAMISAYAGASNGIWRYDRALTIGILAAAFLMSSAVAPLTAPYVRDLVTPKHSKDSRFVQANKTLTRAWSRALAVVGVSLAVGATLQTPFATTTFNWLIPMFVVAVAAARLTPASENDGRTSVRSALDSLMSDSHERETPPGGPRRLTW
jgi:hypothetical protein